MTPWPAVPLSSVADIVSGGTPKSGVSEYWGGDIAWATPKDLSDLDSEFIRSTPRSISDAGLRNSSAILLPTNSVLFSSRAPIGHTAINTVPMCTNQGFKSFVPDTERLDSKYLLRWLRANRMYLESLGNGATFKEVSKAVVSKVEIPLPSLPEQRRIAAILDHADELRAKRRRSLALLDELTQSTFADMFGTLESNTHSYPVRELKTLVPVNDKINYGVVQPGENFADGVPLVRAGDIANGRIDTRSLRRISVATDERHKRSRLVGDEILISCVGSIGAVALATPAHSGFNIARAVARVRCNTEILREYLAAYLRTPAVLRYYERELRTVAQPTLNIKQIELTKVLVPPIQAQQRFVDHARAYARLATQFTEGTEKVDTLLTSLQTRAFRGEL